MGAPFKKDDAICDQAAAASVMLPGMLPGILAGSLASLAICSCHRSRYLFANASKSGGSGFSFVKWAFPGLFRGCASVLLCIAQ